MIIVPKAFIDAAKQKNNNDIKVLMGGIQNVIINKTVTTTNTKNERYVASNAITIVHAGRLQIKTGFQHRIIKSGEMVFLPKGLYMLSDIIPDYGAFKATVLFFEDELMFTLLDNALQNNAFPNEDEALWYQQQPKSIKMFVKQLDELYGGDTSFNHHIIKHKLSEFLQLLLNTDIGASFRASVLLSLKREKENINLFMNRHFDKPLQISDYAYLTGRSKSTFHRDFKRLYNVGPKQWLIEQRLNKAKRLIEKYQSHTVSHIAFDVGYENTSNFIKAFQKRFGLSPKQYQMSIRKHISID